jgi:tetratricopeptide (TPR) repeat protein
VLEAYTRVLSGALERDARAGLLIRCAALLERHLSDPARACGAYAQALGLGASEAAILPEVARVAEVGGLWDELTSLYRGRWERQSQAKAQVATVLELARVLEARCPDWERAFEQYLVALQIDPEDEVAREEWGGLFLNIARQAAVGLGIEKPQPEPGYIYCFQSSRHPDEVKIGRAKKIKPRIYKINKEYRDQNEDIVLTYRYSVRTLDYKRDEKLAHTYFAASRVKGEIFRTSVESVRRFFNESILPGSRLEAGQELLEFMDVEEGENMECDEVPTAQPNKTDPKAMLKKFVEVCTHSLF